MGHRENSQAPTLLRRAGRVLAVGAVLGMIGAAAPAPLPRVPAARPPAAKPAPVNVGVGMSTASQRLSAALQEIHMTFCAATAQRAFDFLLEGREANFAVQPLGPDADRWPVVITMESAHPSAGQTRFSTLMIASVAGCAGMYEQTIYWDQPCDTVRSQVFGSFQKDKVFLSKVHVAESGAALQLYTMPAGKGCISVKKELFR